MPKTKLLETANDIMALLKNAKRIAILRQDRRMAMDVLRACSKYIQGTKFPFDYKFIEKLADAIIDKNNYAILESFDKVENELSTIMKHGH